jgi:predicted PurR-regulated permease PerM
LFEKYACCAVKTESTVENFYKKYLTGKNLMFTVAVIIVLLLITQMQEVAILFFASFVIACPLNPVVDKVATKCSRPKAAAVVLFGTMGIIALFFVPLIVLAGHEIKAFALSFPQYLDSFKDFVQDSIFLRRVHLSNIDLGGVITSASGFTSKFFDQVVDAGVNLRSAFVYLLASTLIIYYFMADKEELRESYKKLFPKTMREKATEVLDIISKKVGGYIVGQLTAMAGVGIVMTLGLLALRVDYAVLLGLITAVLDIIPVVGPGIALVICLFTAYKSGPLILVLIAVVFAAAQLIENNFVRPYVFGKLLDIHPILIYLFLFISAKYLGIVGVVFAPAIAATVCVLIQELYIKNLDADNGES